MMRDDDDDVDSQFQNVIGSQYGQMESVMGADGYKAFVEAREAEGDGLKAYAARHKAVADAIRIFTLVFFLAAIPGIVWLWKAALS